MGIFQEEVEIFNIAPVPLTGTFDGQSKVIPVGKSRLPKVAVSYFKNQNIINGSKDPYNPNINGAKYLIGVVGTKDRVTPLTEEEWNIHLNRPSADDEQIIFREKYSQDPKARLVVYGKGRATTASSRNEAGSSPRGDSEFSSK
jgi:hypothetical protein